MRRRSFLRDAVISGAAGAGAFGAPGAAPPVDALAAGEAIPVPLSETASGTANRDTLMSIAAGASPGSTLQIPAGRFPFDDFLVPQELLTICGSGRPRCSADSTTLIGGTQLLGGTINFNDAYGITIAHMGLDVSGGDRDAIRSGLQGGTDRRCGVFAVAVLGSGTKHGALFTSGGANEVVGFSAVNFQHGFVLRCSDSSARGIEARSCSLSGITIKSHPASGDSLRNLVSEFRLFDAKLVITAHGSTTVRANVVSAGQIRSGNYGASLVGVESGGTLGHVGGNTLTGVNVWGVAKSSFAIQSVYSGLLMGCRSFAAGVNGFWTRQPTEVDLVACHSDGDTRSVSGEFRTQDVSINTQP